MSEDLKDRPAVLRRTPRPAPDEKVDPVDYSPAADAPAAPAPVTVPATPAAMAPAGGGVEQAVAPAAPTPVEPAAPPAPAATVAARQTPRSTKASKTTANRKTTRREVTFPLSTRLSQEVIDVLYAAAEDEGISVREAIEQAIRSRWGQS
jgi:hypothetical protein